MQRKRIERLAQEIVVDRGVKARAIAAQLGKPYPTLLRELNPNDKGAKLGVTTLMDLMRLTGDMSPLKAMAEEMGFVLVPFRPEENQSGKQTKRLQKADVTLELAGGGVRNSWEEAV